MSPLAEALRVPRVLVVEDIDTTRRRICAALRSSGFKVVEAADGAEGWKLLTTSAFDAVLLDLVMPHFDGWRFRQQQLEIPTLAAIPTVVVTTRPLTEPDKYALRARAVIQKPFEDDALVQAVSNVCAATAAAVPAVPPAHTRRSGLRDVELFWNRRGEVACREHAPAPGSERWIAERWTPIPSGAGRDRVAYQCQHCSGSGPICHRTLADARR